MTIRFLCVYSLLCLCVSISSCSNSSQAFLEKGRELLRQGKPEAALEYLNKAIDKDATNYEAFNARGVAHSQLKHYDQAQLDYEQATQLNPSFYKPHYNLGRDAFARQNWPQAVEQFSTALKLVPDTAGISVADLYFDRGNAYFELNQFAKTLDDLSQAIRLNPQNHDYYYNRGTTRLRVQDVTGAMDDFRRSIQLNPRFAKAYFTLGLQEIIAKQPDQGCAHLKQAEELGYPDAAIERNNYCK